MHEGDVLVDRYRVVHNLGKGAMGQVWLAYDELLNRRVAIKHLLAGSQESLRDELVQRAMREARLAAQLNHPNAVQIFDLITSEGVPHVVMEYVEGETLANRLESGRLAPHAIRPVIRQVAAGLAAAHDLGIVHRDVKPANILIANNGIAKLADFGIARASHDANLTITGLVIGTLAYMAPEVAAGDPATPASDVWSLGATAYAATEGRAPFSGESSARMLYRKVSEPPPMPTGAGELAGLMRSMMATEPAERPLARDVVRALDVPGPPSWPGAQFPTQAPNAEHEPTTVRRRAADVAPTAAPYPFQADPATVRIPRPDPLPTTEPRRRSGGLVAALVALALVIAGGVVAIVLTTGSGGNSAAGTSNSPDLSAPPPPTVTVTTTPSVTTPTSSTVATSSPPPVTTPASIGELRRYVGPNGLSVLGPSSWHHKCAGSTANYQWCAGPDGFAGGYFRLKTVPASFDRAVQTEKASFPSVDRDLAFSANPVPNWPLSADAVDLTYTFFSDQTHEARKGIERIFSVGGTTLAIGVTDIPANWTQTMQVFRQLVGSASI